MLFIDTLLLSPIYGVLWAARQIRHALEQERAAEPARITAQLSELYMMLETDRLTEAEFAAREMVLLDQLDHLQERESRRAEPAKRTSKKVRAPRARRSSPKMGARAQPKKLGQAPTAHPDSQAGSEALKEDGAAQVTSRKNGIVKAAAMVILPLWICWPSAGAEGDSNATARSDRLSHRRLAALAMVESGCGSELACRADRLVGRAGEVSRYQILPAVWRQHHRPAAGGSRDARWCFRDPALAKAVAERVMDSRTATFVGATRRRPSDFEWYVIWNAPGAFARAGYAAHRLSPAVQERARRFSNLMMSEERLVRAN
jgi:hypothetical protein